MTLDNVSNAGISPSTGVVWLDSSHAFLSPAATTDYVITAHSPCRSADTVNVLVVVLAPVINIISDNNVICPSDSALLCAPDAFSTYLWSTGQTSPCIYTSVQGTYTLSVSEDNTCSAVSNPITVTVLDPSPVELTVHGDVLIAYNGIGYQWYLNDTAIAGATSSVYTATVSGLYSAAVIDSNGCRVVSTEQNIVATGISEPGEIKLEVYPNPLSVGNWQLDADKSLLGSIYRIFDSEGKLVYKSEISGVHAEIIMDAAKGVYWMEIYTANGVIVKKLVRL